MKKAQLGLSLLTIVTLNGCSASLDVRTADEGSNTGMVFALPMTQYDIEVTRRVASCREGEIEDIKIATAYKTTKRHIEDSENVFVIDPTSLSKFWNSGSTGVTFHEGSRLIKSFNGKVVDNAGPAINSVVNAVASVLSSGLAGVPATEAALLTQEEKEKKRVACRKQIGETPSIEAQLSAAKALEKEVVALTAKVTAQRLVVGEAMAEQAKEMPAPPPATNEKVAADRMLLRALIQQLGAKSDMLKAAYKPLTYVQKVTWPTNGSDLVRDEVIAIKVPVLKKWVEPGSNLTDLATSLNVHVSLEPDATSTGHTSNGDSGQSLQNVSGGAVKVEQPAESNEEELQSVSNTVAQAAEIAVEAETSVEAERASERSNNVMTSATTHDPQRLKGLAYRTPATGFLVFKMPEKDDKRIPDRIAQLGSVDYLKISTRPFESFDFLVEYDKEGGLTSAGYTQTASASAAVSSILDNAVEKFEALAAEKAGRDQAKLDADLKELQAEVAIRDAQLTLNPPPTSEAEAALNALTDETTLLEAEIARLQAEKTLNELRAP